MCHLSLFTGNVGVHISQYCDVMATFKWESLAVQGPDFILVSYCLSLLAASVYICSCPSGYIKYSERSYRK